MKGGGKGLKLNGATQAASVCTRYSAAVSTKAVNLTGEKSTYALKDTVIDAILDKNEDGRCLFKKFAGVRRAMRSAADAR